MRDQVIDDVAPLGAAEGANRAATDRSVRGRRAPDQQRNVGGTSRYGIFDSENREALVGASQTGVSLAVGGSRGADGDRQGDRCKATVQRNPLRLPPVAQGSRPEYSSICVVKSSG